MADTVWSVDIGGGYQRDQHSGRLKICGNVFLKVAGFPEVIFIDPDIGSWQKASKRRFKTIQEAVDPIAIVAVSVANEHVVVEARHKGHRECP